MRNIGGGIGISLVTTWLSRHAQAYQALLGAHLSQFDPATQEQLQTIREALARHTGPVSAARQAWGVLYNTLLAQATLLAYVDTFRRLALLCLMCIPAVLLFASARRRGPVTMH